MERKIILTADGSHSISIPEMDVTYHSIHGAIQESMHVFIGAGYTFLKDASSIRLLEVGMGTGLNALLTLLESDRRRQTVHYTAIELFPLKKEQAVRLNYCETLNKTHYQLPFEKLHACDWEQEKKITPFFVFNKINVDLKAFSSTGDFDLVYFDAFAPNAQPELWTKEIFEKLYSMMREEGVLVTYCSKGDVRRALQAAGFAIEKIPGPARKREMLRARK